MRRILLSQERIAFLKECVDARVDQFEADRKYHNDYSSEDIVKFYAKVEAIRERLSRGDGT
jgi:hypothetical protein